MVCLQDFSNSSFFQSQFHLSKMISQPFFDTQPTQNQSTAPVPCSHKHLSDMKSFQPLIQMRYF